MSGCVIYILLLLSKPSTRRDNSNKATRYNNAIWKCSDLRLILKQILYQTLHNNKQQQSFSYSRTTKTILRQNSWYFGSKEVETSLKAIHNCFQNISLNPCGTGVKQCLQLLVQQLDWCRMSDYTNTDLKS